MLVGMGFVLYFSGKEKTMREKLFDAEIQFEREDGDGETFFILRLEFGKKNILTLVRKDFEELLKEVPGFIKHSMSMSTESMNKKLGIAN